MNRLLCFFGVCIGRPHPDAKTHAELAAVAPHVRGPYNQARINQGWAAALVLVLALTVWHVGGLVEALSTFAVAYAVGASWEGLFAHVRGRSRQPGLLVTALLFTALVPPASPLWHVALGMSFAVVFAQEVFGGHGKTFLPPALVAAAVLQVSFPGALADTDLWHMVSMTDGVVALASVLAAAALVVRGVMHWRPIFGVALGVLCGAWLSDWNLQEGLPLLLDGLVFCAVFVATDPAGSASTHAGRWLQGLLAGVMVVLIRVYHPVHPDGVVSAFLFAAIMAPLIDAAVVRLQVRVAKARAATRRARL